MVAYSFKPRFVDPILAGTKGGTIRALRHGFPGHAYPGQKLQLYTGMRTKHCALIARTVCIETSEIMLRWRPVCQVWVASDRMAASGFDEFARFDGFADFSDMERFWAETHPNTETFLGAWIKWERPKKTIAMGATVE